jgi:hypothetical protein
MPELFLILVVVVAVVGIGLSLTRVAWPFSALDDLGRTGAWFHHPEMDPPDALPDPNVNDPAIHHRPLRGRD